MSEKQFDLATILSFTTGRLFVRGDEFNEALDFLAGPRTVPMDIEEQIIKIQSYVLEKYPELKGVGESVKIETWDDVDTFIKENTAIFGNTFSLAPMSNEFERSGRSK